MSNGPRQSSEAVRTRVNYFLVTVSEKLPLPSLSQVMVPFWNSLIQPPLATLEPPPVVVSSAVGKPRAPVGPPWLLR